MAKKDSVDKNVEAGGQPIVDGHPDNLVQRDVPDTTSAATEERLAEVAGVKPTAEQEAEIDNIVGATSLPRAVIQEQVLAKHPAAPEEEVVNAEDDPASVAEASVGNDLIPEPKRVVKGTEGTPEDLVK